KSIGYKFNDTGWFDQKRSHLFVADLKAGRTTQITSGEERNDLDPRWSPDGTKIAFSSEDTAKAPLMNNDIWVVSASGGELTRINEAQGSYRNPRWSPDGSRIAFAGAPTESDVMKLRIASASGGGKAALASREMDLTPADIVWESDNA